MQIFVYEITIIPVLSFFFMQLSQFLAQILGVVYVVVGLGIFLEKKHYQAVVNDFIKSPGLMYYDGVLVLLFGFLITSFHNFWGQNWQVIITVIGWLSLVKGVVMLVMPGYTIAMAKKWSKHIEWAASACLGLGVVLSYFGFLA